MNNSTLFKIGSGLLFSYFLLLGILYYGGNTMSLAGRRPNPLNPACIQGVKSVRVQGNCSLNGARGYRESKFECFGGARGELHARGCISLESFKNAATDSCVRMSLCSVTVAPTLMIELSPSPTPEIILPETGTPTPTTEVITPTPCAQPTAPICEGGTLTASDESQSSGVCGPKFICVLNESLTPTP